MPVMDWEMFVVFSVLALAAMMMTIGMVVAHIVVDVREAKDSEDRRR